MYYNRTMMNLNEKEIRALRYYEGVLDSKEKDPFWCDAKAYVTYNSLFFDGIETEQARTEENRKLNPAIACQPGKVLALTQDLYSACRKYEHGIIHVYRVERLVDYQKFCASGMFTSFISTSRCGFLSSYEDKYDLVLMEIEIDAKTPCVDLVEMVPGKEKEEDGEVLIAPYTCIEVQEEALPDPYQNIQDGRGKRPAVYCKIKVRPSDGADTPQVIFRQEDLMGVQSVYDALNMHACPNEQAVEQYVHYKSWVRWNTFLMMR